MSVPSISLKSYKGWEPMKKPRCVSCKGETANVLMTTQDGTVQYVWECMNCGKTQSTDRASQKRKPTSYKKRYGR